MQCLGKLMLMVLVFGAQVAATQTVATASAEDPPFRVCAMAGTQERPWVGIVWKDTEEAALLKLGDVFRGYRLKAADMSAGLAVFEANGREWRLMVEADPLFAEKHLPISDDAETNRVLTAEEFLNRYPVVVLADGTRLERPPGGWKNEPITFEEFLAQHKDWEGVGLTAADEELAARMAEAAAESERASRQLQSPEDIQRARYEALKRMAAELGMEPPEPEELKPTTYEDFIRMHGESVTSAVPPSPTPAE